MNKDKYAPISITVYDRVWHLKKCIESLLKNKESGASDLYIFSDGPKLGDEEKILEVRKYIDTITGFKNVHKVYQSSNSYAVNVEMALEVPIRRNGKIIIMEDDVVVDHTFLHFMNVCLDKYETYDDVFMISGYADDVNERVNSGEAGAYYCMSASGFGLWESKFRSYFEEYSASHPYLKIRKTFFSTFKYLITHKIADLLHMRKSYLQGNYYGDLAIGEYMLRKRMSSIFPALTLTLNRGYDGTGIHCGINQAYIDRGFKVSDCELILPDNFSKISIVWETMKYHYERFSIIGEIRSLVTLLKIRS